MKPVLKNKTCVSYNGFGLPGPTYNSRVWANSWENNVYGTSVSNQNWSPNLPDLEDNNTFSDHENTFGVYVVDANMANRSRKTRNGSTGDVGGSSKKHRSLSPKHDPLNSKKGATEEDAASEKCPAYDTGAEFAVAPTRFDWNLLAEVPEDAHYKWVYDYHTEQEEIRTLLGQKKEVCVNQRRALEAQVESGEIDRKEYGEEIGLLDLAQRQIQFKYDRQMEYAALVEEVLEKFDPPKRDATAVTTTTATSAKKPPVETVVKSTLNPSPQLVHMWTRQRKGGSQKSVAFSPTLGDKTTGPSTGDDDDDQNSMAESLQSANANTREGHLKLWVKEYWRFYAFLNPTNLWAVTIDIGISMTCISPEDDRDVHEQFYMQYSNKITSELNGVRQNVTGNILKLMIKEIRNGYAIPTKEEMLQCLTRDPKVPYDAFKFYWTKVLPLLANNQFVWDKKVMYYETICEAKDFCQVRNAPNPAPRITPMMEAIACLWWHNVYSKARAIARHPAKYKVKILYTKPSTLLDETYNVHPEAPDVPDDDYVFVNPTASPEYATEYTKPNTGQKIYGGFSDAGLKKYKEYVRANASAREKKETATVENKTLEQI